MRRRPTKKTLLVLLVGFLLLGAGSTAQAGWLFVISAAVFALIGASLFVRHRLRDVVVDRSVPLRVRAGDEVRVGLSVQHSGRGKLPRLALVDHFAAYGDTKVAVDPVSSGTTARLELVKKMAFRGRFADGSVELLCGAPFGLMRSKRVIEIASPCVVIPRWVDLRSFPLLEPSSFPSEELHERARTGGGQEVIGVREYRPGDPRKAVHWKSTARAGRLVVREFHDESSTRVALVIGGVDHGERPDSSFEAVVSAAASIGAYALVTGHPIDLLVAEDGEATARLSSPERVEMLEWLAGVSSNDRGLQDACREAVDFLRGRGTVVLCCTSAGAASASLPEAVSMVQASGARAIIVMARSETWDPSAVTPQVAPVRGRAVVKFLDKDKDIAACLA